jgi:diguanylate cyclase (GGDEF)-like protein
MANGGLTRWVRFLRLGAPQRIVLLSVTVAAAAVTLFAIVVRPLPAAPTALSLPWVLWAAAFAGSEALVVHVQWNRESHTFSLSDLVLAAGLVLATPAHVVTAQVVGAGVTLLVHRRQFGVRLAFNLAQYGLGAGLATLVYTGFVRLVGTEWSWLAALLGVGVFTTTAALAIFGVMTLSEGHVQVRALGEMLALSAPFTLGAAAVGVVLARTAVHDPAALALLALPAILIVTAYRAYTKARDQQENMRLLHEVTSLLHAGGDMHEAVGDFLTSIRSAFRANLAELVLLGDSSAGDGATVSRSQDDQSPLVMARVEDAEQYARLLRLATASGTLRTRVGVARGRAGQLDAYVTEHGFKDGMVAVLRTEDRVHGLLLVAGRFGDVTTFSNTDVALLDTFARHVATSLERGRLEETLRQVTDLKEQLRHQALHDSLTGLPNRTLFLDRARQAVDLAGRSQVWPAVLYIDLDGFKPVNDTFGHDAGDLLLRTVATRIRGCLRPSDTAARLGGDEFAVLLNGPVDRPGVARVLGRLRSQLDVPVDLGDGRIATVGMSVGVALGGADVEDADALIRRADIAMYAAKRGGGNDFLFYEPALGDPKTCREDAEAELAAAIRGGDMRVVYQPLMEMRTGRPIGAEALVRWQHPDGLRTPEEFIGLAEDTGLITELGAFVLRDACRQAARWVRCVSDDTELLVTVNLSARQLSDPRIVPEVSAALAAAGLEPRRLVLEITETVLMQDRDAAASTLWQLKGLGVRIAIDDFGTGYSSLAYLRRFPIDMLKVAREFVDGLGRDVNDDAITRAIVDLAGTLGLLTIAEGIETTQQQEHVAALGCQLAQGYLYSRPVDADVVMDLVSSTASPDLPMPDEPQQMRLSSV